MPVLEDRRFVRGRGAYVNDVELPGMLHMSVAAASVAHARVLSVDVSAARRAPGWLPSSRARTSRRGWNRFPKNCRFLM